MSWQRKQKMPKPRIPVAKPGIRHRSEKDYVRQKKVDIPVQEETPWDCIWDEMCDDESSAKDRAEDDLYYLLYRFGITTIVGRNRRVASYK